MGSSATTRRRDIVKFGGHLTPQFYSISSYMTLVSSMSQDQAPLTYYMMIPGWLVSQNANEKRKSEE